MTLFSKLLKHYIDSSGYTIYQIAKRSGVNRTSIQKALSEDRLPLLDSIKELEKYLNLTPEEHRQFWSAYEMAFYGESVFYQRQSVRQLITALSQSFYESRFLPRHAAAEIMPVSFHSRKLYHSPYEFCQIFRNILENESQRQENSVLSPVLISFSQTPPPFIFDNFASFLSGRQSSRIRIQQIIHFIKNPGNSGKPSYNLNLLSRYLPYIFINRENYEAYYCYRESLSETLHPELFPSYMVFDSCVLLFSIDYQTIWVESDGEILSHFRSIFRQSLEEARPLVSRFDDFMEMSGYFRSIGLDPSPFTSIEHMPSSLLLCTRDILNQEMLLPKGRASHIMTALAEWRGHFLSVSRAISVFSSDSLNQFALTGVLSSMPESFVRPFTVQERALYLENLENIMLLDNVVIRAVLPSRMQLSPGLNIALHGNSGISFGFLDTKKESWYYISITENTIVDSFRDFIDNSLENQFFLSEKDTLSLIHKAQQLLSETV